MGLGMLPRPRAAAHLRWVFGFMALACTAQADQNYVIGVKTGSATFTARANSVLESWGAKVQDLVFLSDDKNLTSYRGKDVVYAVFTEGLVPDPYTKERRKEREKPKEIGVQDIVADIDTLGKDLDRTKFFGGLRYLRKRYPNKTWYIIFDDDTYVFLNHMEQLLEAHGGNNPGRRYIGNGFRFWGGGCDRGNNVAMAHGGAGVFVSAQAVDAVQHLFPECNTKYGKCGMGDARLAMCLADVDIKLSPNRGLYKNSIMSEEKIFRNPCFAPYTFHHMNADMFKLANLLEDPTVRPSAQQGCKYVTYGDVLMSRIAVNNVAYGERDGLVGPVDGVNLVSGDWKNCKCDKDRALGAQHDSPTYGAGLSSSSVAVIRDVLATHDLKHMVKERK
eukprot:CAMPEP_0177690620 /NCGR_PEP_ID=MMETSP0484_2-20121128/865_1 /TAXON_ID=354590 /ORGANISM="Rhodomonas lens, Strain RHODO" /LENGTH=389 /DNA_ID=CAMNT_0019201179 /DNA_START=8 /DNA_END=1174 /DNA_ORIENTATION=+